jgi:hypothetical protein
MIRTVMMALTLVGSHPSARDAEIGRREAFAVQVRTVIERGDVEGFITMLSPNGIRMGDGIVPTKRVAAEIRNKKGVYAGLFETAALHATSGANEAPVMSDRDFFRRAKDAVLTIDLDSNRIRWGSASVRAVPGPPSFGVEQVKGRLRIGCIGEGCD